jgi:hypothetical protein
MTAIAPDPAKEKLSIAMEPVLWLPAGIITVRVVAPLPGATTVAL